MAFRAIAVALYMLIFLALRTTCCNLHTNHIGDEDIYAGRSPTVSPRLNADTLSNTSYPINDLDINSLDVDNLDKRWYGLKGGQAAVWPHIQWPMMGDFTPSCHGSDIAHQHWVRYCFKDERSRDRLFMILVHAIARWGPAMQYSTLRIEPDTGCGNEMRCVCGAHTSADALEIWDGNVNGALSAENLGTSTSVGYSADRSQGAARNSMKFTVLDDPATHRVGNGPLADSIMAITMMVHELGHAIGLLHEHQRPDAVSGGWIQPVHFQNIAGYAQAMQGRKGARLMADPAFPAGMSAANRMVQVCQSYTLAERYFPQALDWMSGDRFPNGPALFQRGTTYDYKSIMHYNSRTGAVLGGGPILVKGAAANVPPGADNSVYLGGTADYTRKAISSLDVARVAELYPLNDLYTAAANDLVNTGGWVETPVVVPRVGLVTSVVPAPP